jgi:signal transduction histidine kinase
MNQIGNFQAHLNQQKKFFHQTTVTIRELALSNQYNENIGKLAAGIAHEIRNPLTTIKGFLQLIQPYLISIDKEQYATITMSEIDRINAIIYDFLQAAKPFENIRETISINQLIEDICLLYKSESLMKNISVSTNLIKNCPSVFINRKQLQQVLVNIFKNAFEAIEEKKGKKLGMVHISTYINQENVIISIKDNGCGIEEESLNNIFDPFYTTKKDGTGVGLNLCKKMIEEAGGHLYAKSKLNVGTTFIIELPISPN